jgi:microcystin-dependent protein
MADVRLRDLNPAVLDYDLTVAGSVGIGTTAPAGLLHLVQGSTTVPVLRLVDAGVANYDFVFPDTSTIKFVTNASSTKDFIINNEGAGAMNLLVQDGKVGIGTTSPDALLELETAAASTCILQLKNTAANSYPNIRFLNDAAEWRIYGADGSQADKFVIHGGTNGALGSRLVIDTSGNVGIGTTAPDQKLSVSGNIQVRSGGWFIARSADNAGYSYLKNPSTSGSEIAFHTSGEKMRLLSNGNFGIGTTSPSWILHTSTASNYVAKFESTDSYAAIILEDNNSTTDGNRVGVQGNDLFFTTAAAERMRIDSTGKVGIGTTSPTETLHVNGNLKVTGSVEVGASGFNVSTGFILAFGVAAPPSGWLACNGSAVSRTTYSALYALIGTTYGAGNGSSTFNVPDLRGRTLIGTDGLAAGSFTANLGSLDNTGGVGGAQNHTLTTAEMPAHTHAQEGQSACGHDNCNGGWAASIYMHRASSNSKNTINNITSTGGGGSHNNVQPSMAVSYLIKT